MLETMVRDTGRAFVNPEAHVWTFRDGNARPIPELSRHSSGGCCPPRGVALRAGNQRIVRGASRAGRARMSVHLARATTSVISVGCANVLTLEVISTLDVISALEVISVTDGEFVDELSVV